MPSEERDVVVDAAASNLSRDRTRRSKADRKSDKDGEHRHRSSKTSRSKLGGDAADADSTLSSTKRHRKKDKDKSERPASTSDLAASLSNISLMTPRISLPYPTFSKAHSKEAVHSREDLSGTKQSNPLTPEPTDVGNEERRSKSTSKKSSRPPSPPETDLVSDKRRAERLSKEKAGAKSASRNDDGVSKLSRKSASSSQATYVKSSKNKSSHERLRSSSSLRSASSRHSTKRSAPIRTSSKRHDPPEDESSPSSAQDSSPRTPTPPGQFPSMHRKDRPAPRPVVGEANGPFNNAIPASAPALDVQDAPRVDYLLQNGGLAYTVPQHFLSVLPPPTGARCSGSPLNGAETLFAPFFNLLDQYATVVSRQGSIAVATGHRSVARRLLDRLENVFSRDLPPHGCACVVCDGSHEIHRGLNWGDVLEWVCGRVELPPWPPFDLAEIGTKAAEDSADVPRRPESPVNMDPDIAEEFREHYLRQSKKVRSAVDKWLNKTGGSPVPLPQEVDDETLAFAVLTSMDPKDRPYFSALLSGSRELKSFMRGSIPGFQTRSDFIVKCGLSLQRLYRLQQAPRDAESAMYLVKNPHTHDLLVTISSINNSEWEILTSGRFDGFLWSGADADGGTSEASAGAYLGSRSTMSPGLQTPPATGFRNANPHSPYFAQEPSPASFVSLASSGLPGGKQPVSNDEEMEMEAAAAIEREIYLGMETLEDAFEKLHQKAEMVRTALRLRGAGLMHNIQNRRRLSVPRNAGPDNGQTGADERPTWEAGGEADGGSDDDWCMDDADIMPDDSASNISSSRHRRPKRRTERRTPAVIEEDDEE
ncbi:hypothetical protein RJ55_06000 [Drechmeria coniospora]|nr:hypothetical protein RJ55_06000 [Drechmeria coniospora]